MITLNLYGPLVANVVHHTQLIDLGQLYSNEGEVKLLIRRWTESTDFELILTSQIGLLPTAIIYPDLMPIDFGMAPSSLRLNQCNIYLNY
jgi:hypothetical protein